MLVINYIIFTYISMCWSWVWVLKWLTRPHPNKWENGKVVSGSFKTTQKLSLLKINNFFFILPMRSLSSLSLKNQRKNIFFFLSWKTKMKNIFSFLPWNKQKRIQFLLRKKVIYLKVIPFSSWNEGQSSCAVRNEWFLYS